MKFPINPIPTCVIETLNQKDIKERLPTNIGVSSMKIELKSCSSNWCIKKYTRFLIDLEWNTDLDNNIWRVYYFVELTPNTFTLTLLKHCVTNQVSKSIPFTFFFIVISSMLLFKCIYKLPNTKLSNAKHSYRKRAINIWDSQYKGFNFWNRVLTAQFSQKVASLVYVLSKGKISTKNQTKWTMDQIIP